MHFCLIPFNICSQVASKKMVLMTFLDLEKAVDSVNVWTETILLENQNRWCPLPSLRRRPLFLLFLLFFSYIKTNINEGECRRICSLVTSKAYYQIKNNKQTDSRFTFKTGIKQFYWRYALTVIVLVLSMEFFKYCKHSRPYDILYLFKQYFKSKVLSFADGTVVLSIGCSWDEVFEQTWSDLLKLKMWFDTHYTVTLQTC